MRHQGYIELGGTPLAEQFGKSNELASEYGQILRSLGKVCIDTQPELYVHLELERYRILTEMCEVKRTIVYMEDSGAYDSYYPTA